MMLRKMLTKNPQEQNFRFHTSLSPSNHPESESRVRRLHSGRGADSPHGKPLWSTGRESLRPTERKSVCPTGRWCPLWGTKYCRPGTAAAAAAATGLHSRIQHIAPCSTTKCSGCARTAAWRLYPVGLWRRSSRPSCQQRECPGWVWRWGSRSRYAARWCTGVG